MTFLNNSPFNAQRVNYEIWNLITETWFHIVIGYYFDTDETGGLLDLRVYENGVWQSATEIIMGAAISDHAGFSILNNIDGYLNNIKIESDTEITNEAKIDIAFLEGEWIDDLIVWFE